VRRQAPTGRSTALRLTPAGRRQAQSLLSARLGALDEMVAALSPRERATFERLLDKVLSSTTTSRAHAMTTCRLCDHAVCDGPRCPVGTRATHLEATAP
jgi:hypothetical protein